MKIISFTLVPLIVLSVLSVVFGNEFIGIIMERDAIIGYAMLNATITEMEIPEAEPKMLNIDPITGAIGIIVIIATATALLGIKVLGSGLSDESVRVLITTTVYASIWTILSLLAIPLISSIEIFGSLIYIILTIGYVIGVIEKISGVE